LPQANTGTRDQAQVREIKALNDARYAGKLLNQRVPLK
jgi:hypothetical protein